MDYEQKNHNIVDTVGYGKMKWEVNNSQGETIISFNLRIRCSYLVNGEYDSTYNKLSFRDIVQEFNFDNHWSDSMASFSTELSDITCLQERFQNFKIIHVSRAQNRTSDSLARTVRAFHNSLFFISCSFMVWIPAPPVVRVIEHLLVCQKKNTLLLW